MAELARQHEPFKRSVGLEQSDQQAIWNYGIWNYGITELWNYGIMKLWNYGLQHPPGKGCSTPLVEGAAPPSRGSSTPWQREQHPLAEGAAPPGTHFGTLRGVGLRKTTDVLEFSSTLMEQRRGVLRKRLQLSLPKTFLAQRCWCV